MYRIDGLSTVHSARFRKDPRFQAAWQRARCGPGRLDDYAYHGYDSHGDALDALAGTLGCQILALPQ